MGAEVDFKSIRQDVKKARENRLFSSPPSPLIYIMPTSYSNLFFLGAGLIFCIVLHRRRQRNGLSRPPGPRGLPVIGNLLDIPKERSWLTYSEWAKTYGDIISIEVFGQVIVVLQSPKAVRDLLDKKGAIYSDRPTLPFYELAKWGWFLPMARSDDQWRAGRRALERGLRPSSALQYRPMFKARTHELLQRLIAQSGNFKDDLEQYESATNMSIAYGYDVQSNDDKFVKTARDFVRMTQQAALPGSMLVNDLPFLKYLPDWLPGTGFKVLAKKSCELGEEVINGPLEFVKEAMSNGTAKLSLAVDALREVHTAKQERDLAIALGSLHAAASDSMVAVLSSLFLVLVLHPSVQEKAQKELDRVTGGTRLPDYEDRSSLPYLDALCKELLRWQMIAPLAFPHATIEDDVYDGYFIPKGSLVMANGWSMLHDPTQYPEPDTFKPERHLNADGAFIDDPTMNTVFGFGKRICPGRHLVDQKLFIAVALVLSTLTFAKAKDANGNEIPVEGTFSGNILNQPDPFQCSIVPRNQAALQLITAAVE
ncbi:cytochrome P450 [Artomyces pyxidatus]|uniref:Cytochrome P450 n=1 Tax=Artomyces pyxidatus TaxID=48021 RepID=A0ACB8STT2_9AGAM|nr:cytochrome P450 [Artomyces pyxidatus]